LVQNIACPIDSSLTKLLNMVDVDDKITISSCNHTKPVSAGTGKSNLIMPVKPLQVERRIRLAMSEDGVLSGFDLKLIAAALSKMQILLHLLSRTHMDHMHYLLLYALNMAKHIIPPPRRIRPEIDQGQMPDGSGPFGIRLWPCPG
jgi:hypothetical protein